MRSHARLHRYQRQLPELSDGRRHRFHALLGGQDTRINANPKCREAQLPFANALARAGAEAVKRYRTVAGIAEDSDMPEIFLGGFIACRLHDELGVHSRIEQSYVKRAHDSGAAGRRCARPLRPIRRAQRFLACSATLHDTPPRQTSPAYEASRSTDVRGR